MWNIKIENFVKYLNSETEFLTIDLENKIKSEDFKNFLECMTFVTIPPKNKNELSIQNQNKIQTLIASKYGKIAKCSEFNLSSRELSKEYSFALSLSLSFSLPTRQLDK